MALKVILIDDHALVRAGTRRVLEETGEFSVVAEFESAEQALQGSREPAPDLILLDINLPGMGGLEALPKLQRLHPTARVVVVTLHEEGPVPAQALRLGAFGYSSKGRDAAQLLECVRSVARGERYVDPEVAQRLVLSRVGGHPGNPFDALTPTELELVRRLSQGLSVPEVAELWHRSVKTLHTHKGRAMEKLGVRNDVEMTLLALRFGLIDAR